MKMFRFVKKVLFIGLTNLSSFTNRNSLNSIPLSCISMNNQECKTRPQAINVNGDEPVFFPFSSQTSKCSASLIISTIRLQKFLSLFIKNLNVILFNITSRTNETRFMEWYETRKCQ